MLIGNVDATLPMSSWIVPWKENECGSRWLYTKSLVVFNIFLLIIRHDIYQVAYKYSGQLFCSNEKRLTPRKVGSWLENPHCGAVRFCDESPDLDNEVFNELFDLWQLWQNFQFIMNETSEKYRKKKSFLSYSEPN